MTVPFKVKSIYEYKSEYEDDLSFPAGELITVNEIEDEEWYSGSWNGKSGMFPKNFVEPVKEDETPQKAPEIDDSKSIGAGAVAATEPADETAEESGEESDLDDKQETTAPEDIPVALAKDELKQEKEEPKEEVKVPKPSVPDVSNVQTPFVPAPKSVPKDPYAIKKDFIASAKSSYVPQVKPRDNSFLVDSGHHQEAPAEVYRENMVKEEEEEPQEKLSLKERIALLQKRQQEEAEREAAALKRQEERKKKLAAEKERKAKELELQKSQQAEAPAGTVDETEIMEDDQSVDAVKTTTTGESVGSRKSSTSHAPVSPEKEPEEPVPEEEEEEEEPADDDEELRRRKLVERMAKISGGRNMFGMMGMSPFGAPAPSGAKKQEEPEEEPEKTVQEEEEQEEMKPVPMLPFADPAALEKLNKAKKEAVPPMKEDSSLGEEEDTEQDIRTRPPPPIPTIPPVDAATAMETDSGVGSADEMKLETPAPEPVSYDADDNDSAKTAGGDAVEDDAEADEESVDEPSESKPAVPARDLPPVPTRDLPVPQPPSAPEAPRSEVPVPPRPQVPAVPEAPVPLSDAVPEVPSAPAPPARSVPSVPVPAIPQDLSAAEPPAPPARSVPPVPVAPVPPAAPVPAAPVPFEQTEEESSDEFVDPESSDDNSFSFSQPSRANTAPTTLPPPVPETRAPPPGPPPIPESQPVPSVPAAPVPPIATKGLKKAATEIQSPSGLTYNNTGSSHASHGSFGSESGTPRRSSTDGFKRKEAQTQADGFIAALKDEIASPSSAWWVKDLLPDTLASRIGTDLIYEVDSNPVTKRGNRQVVYKDYYILLHDLSSITVELQYEAEDPRASVKFTNVAAKPVPIFRKDLLDKSYKRYGQAITNTIAAAVNSNAHTGTIVDLVFGNLDARVLPPIGTRSFGVPIYKNINNHNVQKQDEIRPGDILCIKNGKFQVHKGLGSKTVVVGDEDIYASVIYEHDPKKDKFKVVHVAGGQVKKEAFKMSEMKNGQVRVFRVVGRDYVEW